MLKQLFYKTVEDFSNQYDLNKNDVIELLKNSRLGLDWPNAELLGMTEASILKKLNLWLEVDGVNGQDDPRNLVYIIYINI